MKKGIKKVAQTFALVLALCATSRAWAATYRFSNADSDSLARHWDGGYNWKSGNITFTLSNPSAVHAYSDFPTSGKVALTCISLSSRKDGASVSGLAEVIMTDSDGKTYKSSRVEISNTPFVTTLGGTSGEYTYNAAGSYGQGGGQYTINIYFDSVEVDVTKALTLSYTTSYYSGTECIIGTSVVTAPKTDASNWKAAMRIYGTSIDTATTSTPVLLVNASDNTSRGTAADPATVEWLGLPSSGGVEGGSASQGGVTLVLTRTGSGKFWNGSNDASFTQTGTFIAPSSTDITTSTFSSTVLDEIVTELGLSGTQSTGLGTALTTGLYNGNNASEDETITISGLTVGQNHTLYLAAGKADNATVLPYVKITSCATGTVSVLSYAGASATGWTQASGLSASGTEGEATIFRIRNLYPNSDGQVVLKITNGSHGKSGFSMLALAKTQSPANAAVGDGVKILRSLSLPTTTLLPDSSGSGVELPSSLTVGYGTVCRSDGVAIGNTGIQIEPSSPPGNCTVLMRVSDIPSSGSRLLGWKVDASSNEPFVSYTGSMFEQHYLSGKSVYKDTYGSSAWTRDASEHWVGIAFARKNDEATQKTGGTRTYFDGEARITATGLKWSSASIKAITVGGTANNLSSSASGMVVKDVVVVHDALTSYQVRTITAALKNGWTVGTDGKTLTGTDVTVPFGDGNVSGTITIAADGSIGSFNGSVLSGSVMLPSGSTVASVAAGATVKVKTSTAPADLNAAITGNYAISGSITAPESVAGTIAFVDAGGNAATSSESSWQNCVRSFTGTAPSNPTYTGSQWWWDYEFDGTLESVGSDTGLMEPEGSGIPYAPSSANGNQELYLQKTPYRGASFSNKSELTAVMYCQPGAYANSVLVGFGSTTEEGTEGAKQKAIALVTGTNPAAGDMKLVLTDGKAETDKVKVLAPLKAVGATTQKHLYAFVMDRVTENATEKSRVRVYLDGKVKAIYKHNGTLALSDGFQIGSLHGGVSPRDDFNTGFTKYSEANGRAAETANSGTLDFLRIMNGSLSDNAMAALANAYPYNSSYGEATRDAISTTASWVDANVWTQSVPGQDTATQGAPNADTNVKLLVGGSSVVPVAVNLASDSNYESLTFAKDTGATGSLKLTSDNSTPGKLVSAESSILVDTVIPAGCVALGNASIADGVTLTVDPYSADNHGVLRRLETIGFGETYEDVIISMAILGQGARVVLGDQMALNALGFTATLTYTENNQSYTLRITREAASSAGNITVTADTEGNVTWMESKGVAMPQPATIPVGYASTITVNAGAYTGTITIPTSFAGGTLIVSSGSVDFTGTATVSYTVDGTLNLSGSVKASAIQFSGSGTVNCAAANTLQGTIKGNSNITISYPDHTLPIGAIWTSADWAGTLVLNKCGHLASTPEGVRESVPFNEYGNVNSKIKAPGFKGYAAVADASEVENSDISYCAATLVIDPGEGNEFEFNHGWQEHNDEDIYARSANAGFKFRKLSGTGKLILDGTTDYAQYIFCDVSDFTGDVLITYPGIGGRKSYLFGAPENWPIDGEAFPANLVIVGSVTNSVNTTWDIPAGTIIYDNSTLVLDNGSTNTVLSSQSSGTGTLEVLPNATATVTNIMDSTVTASLVIGSEAALKISDTSLTKLTVPAYSTSGTLDLRESTGLKDLHITLGGATTFALDKVLLPPSCANIYYDIGTIRDLDGYTLPTVGAGTNFAYYATEKVEEYAATTAEGAFRVVKVPSGANVVLQRFNGTPVTAFVGGDEGTERYYTAGSVFSGAACWHEWDFEDTAARLADSGKFSLVEGKEGTISLATTVTPTYKTDIAVITDVNTKSGISSSAHPYASSELNFPTTTTGWSAAVRCNMPTVTGDGKKIAVAFGDKPNGVVGLAAGAGGFVELFNWANDVYTTLAQLKVERAVDDMHIYVLTVTNDTAEAKNYVSLYRDGEFIHKAEFQLTGSITNFMVGAVLENGAAVDLGAAACVATDGYVDYVRLYDKVLSDDIPAGLSARRPFVSQIDLFERTISIGANWVAADGWTKKPKNNGAVTTASAPEDKDNVTLTVGGTTTLTLNLDNEHGSAYETLIFDGSGTIGVVQGATRKISADMLVVRTGVDLMVDYDAVNLENAVVGVDPSAKLTFNLSSFPFEDITTTTTNTLAAVVPAKGYDSSCAERYDVLVSEKPDYISAVNPFWDGVTYKVEIVTTHKAGDDVYYKNGVLSGEMAVYTDSSLSGDPTPMFVNDRVNVTDESEIGDVSVYASFRGDLVVSRKTLNITPAGEGSVLDGRTITVADFCTVNFKGGDYGDLTLVISGEEGTGSFAFAEDATVASLSGDVDITVKDGVTLTLLSVDTFITGSVYGTGTIKLPVISEGSNFDFDKYGNPDSVVALNGFDGTIEPNVETTLRLDGAVSITAEAKAYSFANITGSNSLSFTAGSTPTSITINEVADYEDGFAINNASGTNVTVGKLFIETDVPFGAKMLDKTGDVVVGAVHVGGVVSEIVPAYTVGGVYKAVASYDDTAYESFAAVIGPAGENLADVVVYDLEAESGLAGDYEISGGHLATKDTDYTWVGVVSGLWTARGNWEYGDNETATRLPGPTDRVIFSSEASVTLTDNVSVGGILCDANLTFTGAYNVEAEVILTKVGARITSPRELSVVTDVPYYTVKEETVDGNKVYSLVKKPGTIFSVY